jgi:hypothetical protein
MALESLSRGEAFVAMAAVTVAVALALVTWIRRLASKSTPDPWPQEVDEAVRNREAVPICLSCLYPQGERSWLCPHCGFPAGDFVTLMPYLQNFAIGELFRRGVMGPPERSMGRNSLLTLLSLGEYGFFAPIYWYWMIRKAMGKPICQVRREDIKIECGD